MQTTTILCHNQNKHKVKQKIKETLNLDEIDPSEPDSGSAKATFKIVEPKPEDKKDNDEDNDEDIPVPDTGTFTSEGGNAELVFNLVFPGAIIIIIGAIIVKSTLARKKRVIFK